MEESEVAHGARRRTNVERIARSHQDYAQTIELICGRRQCLFSYFEKPNSTGSTTR
jgi:hypothetical protein